MKALALAVLLLSSALLRAGDVTITAIGDSLTYGLRGFDDAAMTQPMRPYPTQLSEILAHPVANTGKGGLTASAIEKKWLETATAADKAGIVIIGAGTNDRKNPDSAAIVASVRAVLDSMTGDPKKFIVILQPHISATSPPEEKANILNHHNALKAAFPEYVLDMWDFHVDPEGLIATDYRRFNENGARDNLHPNSAWYGEVARRVADRIKAKNWLPAP